MTLAAIFFFVFITKPEKAQTWLNNRYSLANRKSVAYSTLHSGNLYYNRLRVVAPYSSLGELDQAK